MRKIQSYLIILALTCVSVCTFGQSNVSIQVQSFPSPYFNTWKVDPNLTRITGNFNFQNPHEVVFQISLIHHGLNAMYSIQSHPILVQPGPQQVVIDNVMMLNFQSKQVDQNLEDNLQRTGRFPDGLYDICVDVIDVFDGSTLAQNCGGFEIIVPAPANLILPDDEEEVCDRNLAFSWTPVDWTATPVIYKFKLVELQPNQPPREAIGINPAHLEVDLVDQTSLIYPPSGVPLDSFKTYCWAVQACDINRSPLGENQGLSEVWTFSYCIDTSLIRNSSTRIDSPPRNPHDSIPITTFNHCDPIKIEKTPGKAISGEIGHPEMDKFTYPRAIPLLAMTADYDKVTWICEGCFAGEAKLSKFVRDKMNDPTWKLEGAGKLVKVYDPAKLKALQESLDKAKADKKQKEEKKEALEVDQDLKKNELKELEKQLEEKKKKKSKLDSINKVLTDSTSRLNSGYSYTTKRISTIKKDSIIKGTKENAKLKKLIVEIQKELNPELNSSEKSLLLSAEKARRTYESLKGKEVLKRKEILITSKTLNKSIKDKHDALKTKAKAYNKLREETDALGKSVSSKEASLYSDPALAKVNSKLRSLLWLGSAFVSRYLADDKQSAEFGKLKSIQKDVEKLLLETGSTSRIAKAGALKSSLTTIISAYDPLCDDAVCTEDLDQLKITSAGLDSAADEYAKSSSAAASASKMASLLSLKGALSAKEKTLRDLGKSMEAEQKAYKLAMRTYEITMNKLESQLKTLLKSLEAATKDLQKKEFVYNYSRKSRLDSLENHKEKWLGDIAEHEAIILRNNASFLRARDSMQRLERDSLFFGEKLEAIASRTVDLKKKLAACDKVLSFLTAKKEKVEDELSKISEEIVELSKAIEALNEEIEKLESEIAKILTEEPNTPIVYYIPPPLEEVFEINGKTEEFERLKKEFEEAEDSLKIIKSEKILLLKKMQNNEYSLAKDLLNFADVSAELENLESVLKDSKAAYKDSKESKLSKQDDLVKRFESLQKTNTNRIDSIDGRIKNLEDLLSTYEEMIGEKGDSLKLVKAKLDDENRKINTSDEKLAVLKNAMQKSSSDASSSSWNLSLDKTKAENIKRDIDKSKASRRAAIGAGDLDKLGAAHSAVESLGKKLDSEITKIESKELDAKDLAGTASDNIDKYLLEIDKNKTLRDQNRITRLKHDALLQKMKYINALIEKVENDINKWKKLHGKADDLSSRTDVAKETYKEQSKDKFLEGSALSEEKKVRDNDERTRDEKTSEYKGLRNSINDKIEFVKNEKKKITDDSTRLYDNYEEKKKAFYDFLKKELESVEFPEVIISFTASDVGIPDWRSKDGAKTISEKLKYEKKRVPTMTKSSKLSPGKPGDEFVNAGAVCIPAVIPIAEPLGPIPAKEPTTLGREPPGIALEYRLGEPLWEEWPSDLKIPGEKPVTGEALPIVAIYGPDSDKWKYNCGSLAPFCPPTDPITLGVRDLGIYSWASDASIISSTPTNEQLTVTVPEGTKPFGVAQAFGHNQAGDPTPINLGKIPFIEAFLIEFEDTIKTVPGEELELSIRLIDGAHKGVDGETIDYKIEKFEGEQEESKIASASVTTDGSGYAKTKIKLSMNPGWIKISMTWKKTGDKEESILIIPVYHKKLRYGTGPPEFALKKAQELIKAGTEKGEDELEGIVAEFPSREESADSYAATFKLINGLYDQVGHPFKDVEAKLTVGPKIIVKKKEGKSLENGQLIFDGELKDAAKGKEKIETDLEKATDLAGSPQKLEEEYNTSAIKKVKIGPISGPFTLELSEPVPRGEAINIGAKLIPDSDFHGLLAKLFEKTGLTFHLHEAEIDEDDISDIPTVKIGQAIWAGGKKLSFKQKGFDFTFDSLVLTAQLGAGIGGKIGHKEHIKEPVKFYAETDVHGNFFGTLKDLPGKKIGGFKLLKGAAVTVDFSLVKSASIEKGNPTYQGIIIDRAQLVFPERFNSGKENDPSVLTIKDLYLKNSGINGTVTYTGNGVKMGYGGYEMTFNSIELEFKKNKPINGFLGGKLVLPGAISGTMEATVKKKGNSWTATGSTKELIIKPLDIKLSVELAKISYQKSKKIGSLELKNAVLSTSKMDDISVPGLKINTLGDIEGTVDLHGRSLAFNKGFGLSMQTIAFEKKGEKMAFALDGSFSFLGIQKLEATLNYSSGPEVSVKFKKATIEIKKPRVTLKGDLAFSDSEFRGGFAVDVEGLSRKGAGKGISGLLIIGTRETWSYWYLEMGVPFIMAFPQANLQFTKLTGGLGYNYMPPFEDRSGAPDKDLGFSLKTVVDMQDLATQGYSLAGRTSLIITKKNVSLGGKIWFLSKEDALYGVSLMTIHYSPLKMTGSLEAHVKLHNSDARVASFDGEILMHYSSAKKEIKTKKLHGHVFNLIKAEGKIYITPSEMEVAGKLFYKDSYQKGNLSASWDFEVGATAVYKSPKLSASGKMTGAVDVQYRSYTLISKKLGVEATMIAEPHLVKVSGLIYNPYPIGPSSIKIGYEKSL